MTAFLGILLAALVAGWFVTIALKMEGLWHASWATVSFPMWVAMGLAPCFAFFAMVIDKPVYAAFALVRRRRRAHFCFLRCRRNHVLSCNARPSL